MQSNHAVEIVTKDGAMNGWIERAEGARRGSVIVCPEIFGITAHTRAVIARIAREGFDALALNLAYRDAPHLELSADEDGRKRGLALLQTLTRDRALSDLDASIGYLCSLDPSQCDVAILGISAGGHIAYLAGTSLDVRLVISFYGGWLTSTDIPLSQPRPTVLLTGGMAQRNVRLLYFVGGQDFLIGPEQRAILENELTEHRVRHEIIVYPNAAHAFLSEGPTQDPAAAEDAWKRSFAALGEEVRRRDG